jgi:hypothetical protein
MIRTLFTSAALMLAASLANAQITTYMAPPRPLATPQTVASADSARKDSVAQVTMSNMKAWVDSAAGVPAPRYGIDSTALANDPGRPVTTPISPITPTTVTTVTTFSEGSVAPATASPLPMLAVFGFAVFAIGALLLAYRPRG